MESIIHQTLDIVKAQAAIRSMTSDEIVTMIMEIHRNIAMLFHSSGEISSSTIEHQHCEHHEINTSSPLEPVMDPHKSIGLRKVTCLVCGREMKMMNRKHLATHGLTPETYKEQFGLPRNTSLVSKALSGERSKKIKENRIWEKRQKNM